MAKLTYTRAATAAEQDSKIYPYVSIHNQDIKYCRVYKNGKPLYTKLKSEVTLGDLEKLILTTD